YKWYKDGVQLAFFESVLFATEPGEYTVIVSEENCEVEQTIKISQVALEVTLPYSEIEVCDETSYTIVPSVVSVGETDIDVEDLLSSGATSMDLSVTESGIYSVEVRIGDCIYQESIDVLMVVRPELSGLYDVTLCRDSQETVQLELSHPYVSGLHIEWYRD